MLFRRRRGRRRKIKFKIRKDSFQSVVSISLLALAALFLVSFFAEGTVVKEMVQPYLSLVFGYGTVFLPLILGLAGLILTRSFSHPLIQSRILVGLTLLMVCVLGMFDIFDHSSQPSLTGEGGGWLGYWVYEGLLRLAGGVGVVLILLAGITASVLMIFNLSIKQVIEFLRRLFSVIKPIVLKIFDLLSRKKKEVTEAQEPDLIEGVTPSQLRLEEERAIAVSESTDHLEILDPSFQPVSKSQMAMPSSSGRDSSVPVETDVKPRRVNKVWQYPSLDLLSDKASAPADRGDIKQNAQTIEATLASFGIKVRVVEVNMGPSVTQYALQSAEGTKIAKITNLQDDLALALASPTGSVRIEAPIPGRSLIGIEAPNYSSSIVSLKRVLASEELRTDKRPLAVCLGEDVAGKLVIGDLTKMPHVLVAGQTGSGKSILLHTFITTLLFRRSPAEVKFILIDPKRVELPAYNGVPHMLAPVIVDVEKALPSLKWAVSEMERRYKLFEKAKVRDIGGFNDLSGFQAIPHVVIIIDELADLMALAPVEVEKTICRLAQMSRATGIHLIVATQRPSVNVLTGLIKANIPCRISFSVTSSVDSRVIIDQPGAEKLLGKGDMLYVPPTSSKPIRVQGAYVTPAEIKRLTKFLREQGFEEKAPLEKEVVEEITSFGAPVKGMNGNPVDSLFKEGVEVVCRERRASASLLQRRLSIGYSRAARILDEMEALGAISAHHGSKPRDVLIDDPEEFFKRLRP